VLRARLGSATGVTLFLVAAILAGAAGCGDPKDARDYPVPPAEMAQQAVEDVLVAWQKDQPPGKVESAALPVAVYVVDSYRRPGQKLRSFKILGEATGSGQRWFVARLSLENPTEEKKIRYFVTGIDPLWVFREEDYTMLSHWDHATAEEGVKGTGLATQKQVTATGKR
jgi:hypothetical protein